VKVIKKSKRGLPPALMIVLSFVVVIMAGTFILALPISSSTGRLTNPMVTFFTSVSATCVTGLSLVDTGSHFSLFGQVIILLMIQIGGVGLVTFASFLNFLLHRKLELRTIKIATEQTGGSFSDIRAVVKRIVQIVIVTEFTGMVLLSFYFVPKYGIIGLYYSLFLAVSSFCNAGFDITGMYDPSGFSLSPYADNPYVLAVISVMIIIGGLGYFVWNDLIEYRKKRKLTFMSKIVISSEIILLVTGGIFYIFTEWNNPSTLGSEPPLEKILDSFFLSTTMRTAGFTLMPLSGLTNESKMLSTLFMFIGCASGSTGGGIKTNTFAIIIMTVICVIQNKPDTVMFGRRIEKESVYKAFTIMLLSIIVLAIASLILLNTNDSLQFSALDCAFEAASAFGTAGIPTGITAQLSAASQITLCVVMLIGRVGPVTFAGSLAVRRLGGGNEIYPEGKLMVG
jgi:trk system potassium uptake protein TrkH